MNTEIIPTSVIRAHSALIPLPELPITVRLATMDDIPFIDELQKKNNKCLGFMPRGTLEGKIKREEILIAEEASTKVGYLIGNDRYFKRDELGCIFQLCVVPGKRRGLVGATLLKSLFERASYGTKLYCCWCAQDLEANHFWEAMGFVPVAFRTGSRNKSKRQDGQKGARIHIFWQKRIRAGDTETPYWYPHETNGGSIGEDRIVLPIDPRIHWSEVKLEVLPGEEEVGGQESAVGGEDPSHLLPTADCKLPTESKPKRTKKEKVPEPVKPVGAVRALYFGPPPSVPSDKSSKGQPKGEKQKREKRVKQKNDPAKVKAARYIRDRYMEEINRGDHLVSHGKYDVTRLIENVAVPTGALPVPSDQKLLAA